MKNTAKKFRFRKMQPTILLLWGAKELQIVNVNETNSFNFISVGTNRSVTRISLEY